jgi:hypothetical protein
MFREFFILPRQQ